MSRDQCETSGSGAPMRGSVVSNQCAPARSSRTETSRVASSVSPSESQNEGPAQANVPIRRNALTSKAQAGGAAAKRLSMRRGGVACQTSIDIVTAPRHPLPYSTRHLRHPLSGRPARHKAGILQDNFSSAPRIQGDEAHSLHGDSWVKGHPARRPRPRCSAVRCLGKSPVGPVGQPVFARLASTSGVAQALSGRRFLAPSLWGSIRL